MLKIFFKRAIGSILYELITLDKYAEKQTTRINSLFEFFKRDRFDLNNSHLIFEKLMKM